MVTRFLELRDILRIFLFLQTFYVAYDSKTGPKVSRRILETELGIKSVTMFEKYKDKFSASGHVSMGEPRHRFSQLPQFGDVGDDDDEMAGEFRTVSRPKRQRRSTGGTPYSPQSKEILVNISEREFKALPTDDKLVTLFKLMSSVGSQNARLSVVETKVSVLDNTMNQTDQRVRLLEYKSIDAEVRSRRNNLIFRGVVENNINEDCESLVKSVVSENLGLDFDMYIQRAHRLGGRQTRGRSGSVLGRATQARPPLKPRPIIACFRDYQDLETIIANAYKLKDTDISIHRDYPKEIVNARSELWPMYKSEKQNNPRAKVSIGFPAKLIVNGSVIANKFPDWYDILRGTRINTPVRPRPETNIVHANISHDTDDSDQSDNTKLKSQSQSETDESNRDISMQMDSVCSDTETKQNDPSFNSKNNAVQQPCEPEQSKDNSGLIEGQKATQRSSYDDAMVRLSQLPIHTESGPIEAPPIWDKPDKATPNVSNTNPPSSDPPSVSH